MLNKGKGRIQELVLLLADGRCSEDLRALNVGEKNGNWFYNYRGYWMDFKLLTRILVIGYISAYFLLLDS